MGWNKGFTIFEATVVALYDKDLLNKEILACLMNPYRGTDIDSGGSMDLVAKDGKNIEEIVVSVFGGQLPEKPEEEDDEGMEHYYDILHDQFNSITELFEWA